MASLYIIASVLSLISLYVLKYAYPRPYPGIPYNRVSARRLFGDIPDLLKAVKTTNDPAKFVFQQCRKLKSPVIQLFLKPFSNPVIFVDDVREVKDMLGMRTSEFDRAPSTAAAFEPLSPHSRIVKPTNAEWRSQRRYWEGVMGRAFLSKVVAPKMYDCALELIELFKTKAAIADGRPFACQDDFDIAAFDVIWASNMGSKLNALEAQRAGILEAARSLAQPTSKDSPAALPIIPTPEIHRATSYFIHSIEKTLKSYSPPLHHWLLRWLPQYQRYWSLKNDMINSRIEEVRAQFVELSDDEMRQRADTCVLDMGLRRERLGLGDGPDKMAIPSTQELHDEMFLFLIAGHETTAVTLAWSVKFLTQHPEKQGKLRQALINTFPRAADGVLPSIDDLLSKPIPYMDACIEEFVRLGNIHPRLVRIATVDTQVLGYPIPKGAQILSSSYVGEKPIDVPEELRSQMSQQSKDNFRSHWEEGMDDFFPERWIDEDGKYDPKRFPRLAFSAGPRVCYGQRLALQELFITLSLLVLTFKFETVPDELNTMGGLQRVLRVPQKSYIRLSVL
ncbi:hypothetical protein VPNG_09507 [Cytospora leucostoma]|uniref:Cytochrome P450 n=1 Tax=Cytospora leucostoma TaxID=1230097 RepID=A0A423VS42_9PEZI|nr:hypothetical protein VPNG_09507 [Cytospora leucostoma]